MAKIWKIYRVQAADPSPAMSWTSYGCSKSEIAAQRQQSNMACELKLGSRAVTVWTSPIIVGWKGTIISSLKSRGQISNSIWDSPCKDESLLDNFVFCYTDVSRRIFQALLCCYKLSHCNYQRNAMKTRRTDLFLCRRVMETVKGSRILSGLQWLWGLGFFRCPFSFCFSIAFIYLLFTVKQKLLSFKATLNLKHKTLVLFVVLVLAELIFTIVASMGSCFGLLQKTVLTIWKCLHYCQVAPRWHKSLFCPSPHPTTEEPGGAQWVERWHSWDSWLKWEPIILSTWSWERETFGVMMFAFPSHCYVWCSSVDLGVSEHLPAHGSIESIPCFALPVCRAFALPGKLSSFQCTNILSFILPISSSHPRGVHMNEWLSQLLGFSHVMCQGDQGWDEYLT